MAKHPVFYKTETNNYAPLDYVYNTDTTEIEEMSTTVTPDLLKIANATATANDGNLPVNVIDSDENTRWSSQGIGQKLMLDMGGTCSLVRMEITWYKGNERQSNFDVTVDSTPCGSATSETSKPTTTFNFPESGVNGKVITIKCNGNNVNDWNSITTVKVYGKWTQSPLPPPVGPGEEPATPTAIGKDKYGITMLNPTIAGGRTFFPPDPPPLYTAVNATKRIGTTEMVAHGQGSVTPAKEYYKMAGSAPRMYMYKDDGGKDLWTNIEITCYYNRVSTSSTSYAGAVMGGRSYHHLGGTTALAYYLKHHYTSKKFFLMKEQEHGGTGNRGYVDNSSSAPVSALNGNTW